MSGSPRITPSCWPFLAWAPRRSGRWRSWRSSPTASPPRCAVRCRIRSGLDARLAAGALSVVDATNVEWMRRTELVRRARQQGRSAIGITFDLPLDLCLARNAARSRSVRAAVIRRQHDELRRGLDRLDLEGFTAVYVLRNEAEVEGAVVQIEKGPVARAL